MMFLFLLDIENTGFIYELINPFQITRGDLVV